MAYSAAELPQGGDYSDISEIRHRGRGARAAARRERALYVLSDEQAND